VRGNSRATSAAVRNSSISLMRRSSVDFGTAYAPEVGHRRHEKSRQEVLAAGGFFLCFRF
jgi:hypothetical protein